MSFGIFQPFATDLGQIFVYKVTIYLYVNMKRGQISLKAYVNHIN